MATKKKQEIREEIDAVRLVVRKFEELESNFKPARDAWVEDHELYMGTYDALSYKGSSKVKTDAVFRTVESLVANLDNLYWRNGTPFMGKPTEGSDVDLLRNIHTPLMEYQINATNMRGSTTNLHRYGAKYGVFIAKKEYDAETDCIKLIAEDPNTIYWDMSVNNKACLDIIVKRKVVSYAHIQKMGYMNTELLFLPQYKMEIERTEKEEATDSAVDQEGAAYDPIVSKHELLEADISYPIDKDGREFEERIITIINRKVLARNDKNDFGEKRYYFAPFIEIEDSLRGIGVCRATKQNYIELCDTINQSNDNVTRNLNEMRYVNKDAIPNINQFNNQTKNREQGIVYVSGNPNAAVFVDRPPLFINEIRNKISQLESNIYGWSGSGLIQQGMPMSPVISATETSQIAQKADLRIIMIMKCIENNIYNPFVKDLFKYNAGLFPGKNMRLSKDTFMRIMGSASGIYADNFPKSLKGMYDFYFTGSTEAESRLTKSQSLMNFINIYAKIPPELKQDPALKYMLRKEYELITGEKDSDSIFPKEAEKELISPDNENIILANGGFIIPNPMDNHKEHWQKHKAFQAQSAGKIMEPLKFETHIVLHEQILNTTMNPGGRPGETQPGTPTQEMAAPRQKQPVEGNMMGPGMAGETQT